MTKFRQIYQRILSNSTNTKPVPLSEVIDLHPEARNRAVWKPYFTGTLPKHVHKVLQKTPAEFVPLLQRTRINRMKDQGDNEVQELM